MKVTCVRTSCEGDVWEDQREGDMCVTTSCEGDMRENQL